MNCFSKGYTCVYLCLNVYICVYEYVLKTFLFHLHLDKLDFLLNFFQINEELKRKKKIRHHTIYF